MNITDENFKRYVMSGIVSEIQVSSSELPIKTVFGSTDRKTYTVKTTLSYMGEELHCLTDIPPWQLNPEYVVQKAEEKLKNEFAKLIYEKHAQVEIKQKTDTK